VIRISQDSYFEGSPFPMRTGPTEQDRKTALDNLVFSLAHGAKVLDATPTSICIDLGRPGARKLRSFEGTESEMKPLYAAAVGARRRDEANQTRR
jgi:hypothetical protein